MKKIAFILLVIVLKITLYSQQLQVGIGYNYLYSGQWDKCIQTYNFSRPFLVEQQPLLMHGFSSNASYLFKNSKKIKYGIEIVYTYTGSKATNQDFINKLNLHLIDLGYTMHYQNPEKLKHLTFDLTISAVGGLLKRKINTETFEYDEKKLRALGIGGRINLKVKYTISSNEKYSVAPFISVGYAPYYFNPKTEEVLNQTTELVSKNWTGILTSQVGVIFNFQKK